MCIYMCVYNVDILLVFLPLIYGSRHVAFLPLNLIIIFSSLSHYRAPSSSSSATVDILLTFMLFIFRYGHVGLRYGIYMLWEVESKYIFKVVLCWMVVFRWLEAVLGWANVVLWWDMAVEWCRMGGLFEST